MQIPTIGRIVHYKLSQTDVEQIWSQRNARGIRGGGWEGNPVTEGQTVAMMITAVFPDEFGPGVYGVNGRLILDGDDTLWVTSRREGTEALTWSWPART